MTASAADAEHPFGPRKIVHVDMDAFYASVEQRDAPELRGRPVVVAWRGARSVVCAASYEARSFGVHSAMPAVRAERLCPKAVFVPPDFERYRAVSKQVRAIFARHTSLIEPLSLDEAYLDVTRNLQRLPTATAVAEAIRQAIREELDLTASAGVAPNKFLAKIASDWHKPDGLCVIPPAKVRAFLQQLPVKKLPGVGKVTATKLADRGIQTVADLATHSAEDLEATFGRMGRRLFQLARGIDHGAVTPNRPRKSISAEDTFAADQPLTALGPSIETMAEKVWRSADKLGWQGRTVVLKLKTSDFRLLTRSHTAPEPPASLTELRDCALHLLGRVDVPPQQLFRLVGVGMTQPDEAQPARSSEPAPQAQFDWD